jgi:hypothetical protein
MTHLFEIIQNLGVATATLIVADLSDLLAACSVVLYDKPQLYILCD